MNFPEVKSNNILRILIILCNGLVISIYFIYRPKSWPAGTEASGCAASLVMLTITILLLWRLKERTIDESQKKNVSAGICFGLLWTAEIGINNLIHPGLPLRDIIDDTFWAIIALLIFFTSVKDAYRDDRFLSGLLSGFWSGFSSGAVACLTALTLIVFGMKYIITDPLNIREWNDLKSTADSASMNVYFAYQTFAGAIMHLIVLGIIMGLFLGAIGGLSGKAMKKIKKLS
jgi:hypothetical protein